jgi:hypothetical protein
MPLHIALPQDPSGAVCVRGTPAGRGVSLFAKNPCSRKLGGGIFLAIDIVILPSTLSSTNIARGGPLSTGVPRS